MAASTFFTPSLREDELVYSINQFIAKLQKLNIAIDQYQDYFSTERFSYFKENIACLKNQANLVKASDIKNPQQKLEDLNLFLDDLTEKINRQIVSFSDIPEKISKSDKYYNHQVNRICFRGENRPPTAQTHQGIFQIGFSKSNLDTEYKEKVAYLLDLYGPDNRIRRPCESNKFTTNAFSRNIKSAAFFPANPYYSDKKQDEIWIYVVFIEKGFDVSSYSYQAYLQCKNAPYHHLFFAEEICSDEVPPHHVIAAYKIERDCRNTQFNSAGQEDPNIDLFSGVATFKIIDLVFNDKAISYFEGMLHRSLDKEKNLLKKYMEDNQQKGGDFIPLSKDGYTRQNLSAKR